MERNVKLLSFLIVVSLCFLFVAQNVYCQSAIQLIEELAIEDQARAARVAEFEQETGETKNLRRYINNDGSEVATQLYDVRNGMPIYFITNNINAAQTVSADKVKNGGDTNLYLSGDGVTLHIWDEGAGLVDHQEFSGRCISVDNASVSSHSTHCAGTMIASGVNSVAQGMASKALLRSFDWISDNYEMSLEAKSGALVSNHSYGFRCGWSWEKLLQQWRWYGDVSISEHEDSSFGQYSIDTKNWDRIAEVNPEYLIFKSAGNDRNDSSPAAGTKIYYISNGKWIESDRTFPSDGNSGTGFDSISSRGCAKNIVTVGAVNDIPGGYSGPESVKMSSFSSWGPADDGRIKPDIVANGVELYSCDSTGVSRYTSKSGTSMATPSASGAAGLLIEHYRNTHNNQTMYSSTLKGLIIHCADEAGPAPGPDYMYGWGLMNVKSCAEIITADSVDQSIIQEIQVGEDRDYEQTYSCSGSGPIRATICWTDPAHAAIKGLDNPEKALVNDINIIVISPDGEIHCPWKLDGNRPDLPAVRGVNNTDNVEVIDIEHPLPGIYKIYITVIL